MDKSMIKGIAVGGVAMVVLGAGAVTGYKTMTKPQFAEVVAAEGSRRPTACWPLRQGKSGH